MRIIFRLRFHTHPGQSLWLTGDHEILGDSRFEQAIPLQYLNEQFWQVLLVLPRGAAPDKPISYYYLLQNPDGSVVADWPGSRRLNPLKLPAEETLLIDSWNYPGFYENAFYSEPFRKVLLKANCTELAVPGPARATHIFQVKAPLLTAGQTVCLLGGAPELASWNTTEPVLLGRTPDEEDFRVALDLSTARFPLEYKYGVYDLNRGTFVRYEDGPNRLLNDAVAPYKQTRLDDGFVVLPSNTWRGAGVAIPVFSLRTEHSFGVGEFHDLKLLADWCPQVGLKLIQVLPINDTTAHYNWSDSYPYAAISAFALHPLYLNLSEAAGPRHQLLLNRLEGERRRLNGLSVVDYEAVLKAKIGFLKELYPLEKEAVFRREEYHSFFSANRHWLVPYAAFSFLRDQYGTPDFGRWPKYQQYHAPEIAALAAPGSAVFEEIAFYFFVQFHLHLQLEEATAYAHARGIVLKGDIPIGVSRNGADTWQNPELYDLNMQAGAPPDAFAAKGQNWGFPTYNWPRMRETGFQWWKQRFEQMSRYFDAFRVDHILGFFRIWSIPVHAVEGILGYFVPALPVHVNEFDRRGIWFDPQRYTQPFIDDKTLEDLFGQRRAEIQQRFLEPARDGRFSLRAELATQRGIEEFFLSSEGKKVDEALKEKLFDLVSNVILFEVAGSAGQQYHFRFGVDRTTSFQNLPAQTRSQIWELYLDYFFGRQEEFWRSQGLEKLPPLKRATRMLVCGEDLGMVPACVPEVMRQLGLLSLEVQRMPKALGQEFSRPANAPYLAVVTPSTHDMSTIRAWWEEDPAVTQKFFNTELGQPGGAPQTCEPWLNRAVVLQHLHSPAMWSIFQLQDLLGMDHQLRRENPREERINVPANPKNYWQYKLHLGLEDLLAANHFNQELRDLLRQSGRC